MNKKPKPKYPEKRPEWVALGKRIRAVRKEKAFAQEGFAAYANISRAFYGCIERGECNVSSAMLMKIAMKLNVEPAELLPPLREIKKLLSDEK